jgi:hypothetical protein
MGVELMNFAGNYGEVRNGQLFGPGDRGVQDAAGMEGFSRAGFNRKRRVTEAMRLYVDVLGGRTDPIFLREAIFPRHAGIVGLIQQQYPGLYGDRRGNFSLRETMSVTDYQALYVDVLDRLYYGYYNDYAVDVLQIVRQKDLRDFRLVSRYLLDGMVGPMTAIDPAAPAPQRALSGPVPQDGNTFPTTNTAPIQYQPLLYQAMASVNWRAFVNDDLGIFQDIAKRLGMSARMTLASFISGLWLQTTGLNTNLFSTGYRNQITIANGASINNPPLGSQGLMDAYKIITGMRDSAGNPINVAGLRMKLVFGPTNVAVAQNLKKATALQLSVEGGSLNAQGFPTQFLNTNPEWLMDKLDLVLDPWMPITVTSAGVQNTAWALFADPQSVERPQIEVGFLSGFKEAQLFSKVPNTQRMGGGVDAMLGDFNTMDSDTKIVTVFGGTQIDGRYCVGSTGQSV